MGSQHRQSSEQRDMVVHDNEEPCPYLPAETARLPLSYRSTPLSPREFDERMAAGQRRCGPFMYRPACPQCRACEALRLEVARFQFTRTQRRVWKRGQAEIEVSLDRPESDPQRLSLFNRHRELRGLSRQEDPTGDEAYRMFLVETCCDSWEISYRVEGRLVGVAICDRGLESLSAVYCYYDPAESRRSLGVFSVLTQWELCRRWDLRYLYLGYYVAACRHMNYKQGYKPHERLIDGQWRVFERE